MALTTFIGCTNQNDESLSLIISPILIGEGNLYGNGKENIAQQNLIISSNNAWTDLTDKINSANNETDNFTETEIDFSHFILLAAFDEIKMSGGYAIEITSIVETRYDLTVTIRRHAPKGGVYTVITQPYHIVKIPTTDKRIIFNKI